MKITIEREGERPRVFDSYSEGTDEAVIRRLLEWLSANEEDTFWEAINPWR